MLRRTVGPTTAAVSQVLIAEGLNQSATGACTDLADNSASDTRAGVNLDKTPPAIDLVTPPNGVTYLLNAAVSANYTCDGGLSGTATCVGPVASGANIDTVTVGGRGFTVNATDGTGNGASLTHAYSVQYSFVGFLQPVDNLPVINQAKAGRTIPLKWQLVDANGSAISDLASMVSLLSSPIACSADPVTIVEERLSSPGSTVFRWDGTQFIYNWQSASAWRGCRLLELQLSDGTYHYAKFNFK